MTDYIFKWLDSALMFGITEQEFWQMTLAEVDRAVNSKIKLSKIEEEKKASFDYILADLIGRSVSRIYSSSGKMPTLSEAYPSLFTNEQEKELIQEKKKELSILRFKQFAKSYNQKYEVVAKDKCLKN